jgi:galactosylceramidase
MKTTLALLAPLLLAPLAALQADPSSNGAETIALNPANTGKTFEGIGALSAGASSRLLIDYPEPQRGEILDFLFKPNFGAALHHLKVEIGGDVDSTDGTEPSIARSREEFDHPKPEFFQRGYEWWLMKEAKMRNPAIVFDVLQWGSPGWVGNGKFYSQDNADLIVAFIKGAKKYHDLDIRYCGIWNERPYDVAWIKLLRQTLNRAGLQSVQLVAADEVNKWTIAEKMAADGELRDAVQVVGTHYPKFKSTETARSFGKPVWANEDGPWNGDWATGLARSYNRNYVIGKMTKTIIWSPVTSYFDCLPLPGSGLMRANQPWSGHYEVQAAVWITAHTTQFIQPGWKYLDEACRMLPGGGSCVAAAAPDGRAFSVVIETKDAKQPQEVAFRLTGGLSGDRLHLWRSTAQEQFIRQPDIVVSGGAFQLTLAPDAIYSLTTTGGQCKGTTTIPPASPLPLPYRETFETYSPNQTPRWLSDFYGVFETSKAPGGGACLQQTMPAPGIQWAGDATPVTIVGDPAWRDYEISCNVLLDFQKHAEIYGRIKKVPHGKKLPEGYSLRLNADGTWQLSVPGKQLAAGKVDLTANQWHRLGLRLMRDQITARIDEKEACSVSDTTFSRGYVAIGCDYEPVKFAGLSVTAIATASDSIKPVRATSSSDWSTDYTAGKAVDGDFTTRWKPANGKTAGEWLELDFGALQTFNRTEIQQFQDQITRYKIQYWDGTQWHDAYAGGPMATSQDDPFPPVTATKVRLLIEATKPGQTPSIFEFQVFRCANKLR